MLNVQANLAFEIGNLPATANVGLRHEETDVKSSTLLPDVLRIGWVSDNEFNIVRGDNLFFDGEGSYSYLLPNVDFSLEIN